MAPHPVLRRGLCNPVLSPGLLDTREHAASRSRGPGLGSSAARLQSPCLEARASSPAPALAKGLEAGGADHLQGGGVGVRHALTGLGGSLLLWGQAASTRHLLVLRRIVTPVPRCITKNHFF